MTLKTGYETLSLFLVSLSLSLRFHFHDIGEICDVLEFGEMCGYIKYTMAFFSKIIVSLSKIKFKGDVNLAYSNNILYRSDKRTRDLI